MRTSSHSHLKKKKNHCGAIRENLPLRGHMQETAGDSLRIVDYYIKTYPYAHG